MRNKIRVFTGLTALILFSSGCWLWMPSPRKTYRKYSPCVRYSIDSAKANSCGDLLLLVFNDGDTASYNRSVRTLLKCGWNRNDAYVYRQVCTEWTVVKLYRSELEAVLNDSVKYNHWYNPKDYYNANKTDEAFMSLSFVNAFWLHGILPLSAPKKDIHECIGVGFGP